ncbi:hypothetical protein [Aquipuribacter hungaricus]|uniref:Tetratricopeptide repeat protein n=1 Tax=Aquipuribacter hungaricus TaxID=545624 RepID=A0ABV7WEY7_9MICO
MPGFRSLRDRLRSRGGSPEPELRVETTGPQLVVHEPATGGIPTVADDGDHTSTVHESVDEERLHDLLREDPNDEGRFAELAAVVRRRAAEHAAGDLKQAEDTAVWALAEELAHDQRAWYPLVELARLSLHDDREAAIRRLGVAAERDPSGRALLDGLVLLREAGDADGALALGMGHWRPSDHPLQAGRELVSAAVDAQRLAEARRHLDALGAHPDATGVAAMRRDLDKAIVAAERARKG